MTVVTFSRPRDVQVANIGEQTLMLRSRTWERLKFEIEYSRQKGTTANSYLIQADKKALIDPPGESFTAIYLEQLAQHLDFISLDYIILGHVNPNRRVTLEKLLSLAPQATLICSRPAANALKTDFPEWESRIQAVRFEDTLDLGQGHHLTFITVPTPRWPDGLCTYDPVTQILYTDKFFGAHICEDTLFDEDWKTLDAERHYYFDCLHAPQAKQVEATLDKLAVLGARCYAPGHGPVVRYSLSRFTYDYRQWCQAQKSQDLSVALLYTSAYGSTAILANAIAQGLIENGVNVESINCELADPADITRIIDASDGFIIGSPTLGGHAPTQIQTALGIILSTAAKTKLAGVFGSYGWSGEAIDLIEGKLKDANYRLGFETIRVRFSPTQEILEQCQAAGATFAQTLKKTKKLRTPRQVVPEAKIDRTEQAVGRIIGSLCVVTTRDLESHKGILTSWVSQATFNPPGIMIAVAQDQNADLMRQPGDRFVLNILKEDRNLRRYFFRQSTLGENPFTNLETKTADNGCLVLTEALAYLECTVTNLLECGDRCLIYAVVEQGEVLENDGVTAVEHRKSGSQY
ncbi:MULTISPECIES: diflavin flavoprotein [Cyanophyceae]|jgi:flavorubredoxin/flavin reductase (DIM6/NTAB) family NADH-FMN oxidoreductase RutF|uniref:diflavin flavoprotein n=1 Tax=Cyanophyceae TaxID=3028117 RepID=UPI00232FC194|nr:MULTISPECIES: diflavin flavoprotein [Cyanophyceae]MDB9356157.1 diflavin flavoprotein [Nodularia spumigena CS-587/03]MDB9340960.1 diflavin flavoprotein [Nodularia spumigena CS-589/07]MDB9401590.1 diflavin flavoprotein [Microcystis aeruginosa CS-567/02-A1]MDB9499195.1 diflavin flavoprotein [Nodularia spumigena CS-336/02]MDB9533001.1 diflavin flavoprotein [Nodularia spumigena CS-1038]